MPVAIPAGSGVAVSWALLHPPARFGQAFVCAGSGYAPRTSYRIDVVAPDGTVSSAAASAGRGGLLRFSGVAGQRGPYSVRVVAEGSGRQLAAVRFRVA